MSVGWKRQYETETVCDFTQMVRLFAAEKPNDAKLQAFARKCRLTALMLLTQEQKDLDRGDIAKDRLTDCEYCRRWNDGMRPCETAEGRKCVYKQPKHQLQVIKQHFGEEGMHFIDWAGKIIAKREAQTCTR